MRRYESVVILNPHVTDEQTRGCLAKLEEILKKSDAKLVSKVEWGRKPTGFRIKKQGEGYYLLVEFEADPAKISEIQYAFRLADFILFSSIFVKKNNAVLPEQQKIPA
ncbi:MAG: 30S ribosomal protein S6 [Candidatus Omnitrophica bacterium]|nr:30S ribosomal protein S6 [Candidatus Omnitrophota bacterium]